MILNPVPWPEGKRCAVAFTFDMDADSILHLAHPGRAHRMVSAQSMLRYGPEIAVPRILATYRKFGLKQTFFIPGWCIEQYPKAIEAILKDGHEIGHHGYLHEHANELLKEVEHEALLRALEVFRRCTGTKPRGWRAPLYNFSEYSTDLLIQEGFQYDASLMGDDVPYLLEGTQGDIVELPSHWGMDDWPQFVHSMEFDYLMPINAPARAWEQFGAELEAMREHGGLWVPVWHPMVSGRLARWAETERRIEAMLKAGDFWFATMEQIATHVRGCIADGSYVPRVDRLPYYDGPVEIHFTASA